jgi:hypothetical protein
MRKMSRLLLLGAGFSRNWGGLLATEVFNRLLGHRAARDDPELRALLHRCNDNGLGFEGALSQLQLGSSLPVNKASLDRLERAVVDVFDRMNSAFARTDIIFPADLRRYLAHFDAIFTLNQDLLVEYAYAFALDTLREPPLLWHGFDIPGMQLIPGTQNTAFGPPHWSTRTLVPKDSLVFQQRCQPYFKLHGSTNWKDTAGGRIMIMGGNKGTQIASIRMMTAYLDHFEQYLAAEDARLMIVGYGFNDPHINAALIRAVHVPLFLVDLTGDRCIRGPHADTAVGGGNTSQPLVLLERLEGISIRPLRETFGGDVDERTEFDNFFAE